MNGTDLKICDFDLSSTTNFLFDLRGTNWYLPPEAIKNNILIPFKNDIWAAGYVLYILILNEPISKFRLKII